MRSPRKPAYTLAGIVLAGAGLASCMLDLAGLKGTASEATTTTGAGGAGGAQTTATVTGTGGHGGAGGGTSTATGTGGSGGAGPLCGNGTLDTGETCDDHNLLAFDGCSPTCALEPVDLCPGLPVPLAPPGITITGTLAGATDNVKPSCGANHNDVIYEVTPTVDGTLKITLNGAYAKTLSVRSSCLDSPVSEIDCLEGAGDLSRSLWVHAGIKYYVIVDTEALALKLQLDLSTCGDGVKNELEDCDDPMDPTCIGCLKCTGPGETMDPVSHHCYRRITGAAKRDWQSARHDCLAWGGDLAGVSSFAEYNFLKAQNGYDNVWCGATDIVEECQFLWINGEPWQPRWRNNEPNNSGNENCGLFFNNGLDDRKCLEDHDAICERTPAGTCGDKIVQPGEECDIGLTYKDVLCDACKIKCLDGEVKDPATHHCYQFLTGAHDWTGAAADCALRGTYLAAITTPTENALLQQSITAPMWIGFSRLGHPFSWVTTDTYCYTNWGAGSPSAGNDCVALDQSGSWVTTGCLDMKGYICERDN